MKRLLTILAIVVFVAPAAFAAGEARNNVGCGLGTVLFGTSADDSSLLQAFQATTNGTSGNQTFGVSSGTSECNQPKKFVRNDRLNEFVHDNLDELAKNIASGRGESLTTLAELLEIPAAERERFGRNLQAHFGEIFPDSNVEYAHVVDTILSVSSRG
jgi:hypothetical protein